MARRSDSAQLQFEQRIPRDVLPKVIGRKLTVPVGPRMVWLKVPPGARSIRFSLRTPDPREAKARRAEAIAYLEQAWRALRGGGAIRLSPMQANALGGEIFAALGKGQTRGDRSLAVDIEYAPPHRATITDDVGFDIPEIWEAVQLGYTRLREANDPEGALEPIMAGLLLARGVIEIDEASRRMVARAILDAYDHATAYNAKRIAGDYTPDPKAEAYAPWQATPGKADVTITGLLEGWWKEAEAAGRTIGTYNTYANSVSKLVGYLKHDDATRVTPSDIVGFKDHRLASGTAVATINSVDMGALKSIFGWGVTNHKMKGPNPAVGIKALNVRKPGKTRDRGFTPAEAKAILSASLAVPDAAPRHTAQMLRAKRWVPWLCAYTGARVGEIIQLRKQDLNEVEEGVWAITITPEAGTVKDKRERTVVLHEHLVAMGFPQAMQSWKAGPEGHVFLLDATYMGRRSGGVQVGIFARKIVPDKGVSPNHGWRHTFKTIGRDNGIEDSLLDAICGHAPATVGRAYGSFSVTAQRDALEKFPRFVVGEV